MLIIRRKPGEAILIGESIELRIVEVGAGRVTVGIKAPPEVVILREEIRLAGFQNRAAAHSVTQDRVRSLLARLSPESPSGS
jgi:carbon storage regulator